MPDPRDMARARARMERDAQVRTRRRIAAALIAAVLAAASFAAWTVIGQNSIKVLEEADTATVLMRANGSFVLLSVEDFAEEQYDEKELVRTISDALDTYNGDEERIEEKELSFENGKARLILQYASDSDYESFNRTPMYYGKMSDCLADGYDLSPILSSVSRKDSAKIFSRSDFEALGDRTVIYFAEPVNIFVPDRKKILYTSSNLKAVSDTEADVNGTVDKTHPAIVILE